jgi:quercetin dioxygenase-like cupin family protein
MGERTLHNPKTGETITFVKTARDTDGALFQMSYRMAPHAAIADEHAHPNQEMTIEVRSGTLTCTVDGVDRQVRAGETLTIPPGAMHFQRNDSDEEVHALESYRPALQMQEFFEVLVGWANDGKTNEFGLPSRLRLAVLHRYFHRTIISSSRRRNVEARLLAPIGVLRGYRREIERHIAAARA